MLEQQDVYPMDLSQLVTILLTDMTQLVRHRYQQLNIVISSHALVLWNQ